jgi:hypothetical protein
MFARPSEGENFLAERKHGSPPLSNRPFNALKDGDDEEKVCTEYDALPDEGQVARPKAY